MFLVFKFCPHVGYADGFCDDELNTPECGYDGGDCCIHKKKTDGLIYLKAWDGFCEDCQCHTNGTNFGCDDYNKDLFKDGKCDASLNNPECFYDGGDCCKEAQGWDDACQDEPDKCQCLDPFYEESSTELPPGNSIAAVLAALPLLCSDNEIERNGECVPKITSQESDKPFDLSIFG